MQGIGQRFDEARAFRTNATVSDADAGSLKLREAQWIASRNTRAAPCRCQAHNLHATPRRSELPESAFMSSRS